MTKRSIVSPEDQNVTFVELFFDLVFVFSVTQVVGLLHAGLTWSILGQAILVFWLVWWAWTQFTWALNAADTTNSLVQLGVLMATAVAFFMAVALPGAFVDRGLSFAASYVLLRGLGLVLYGWVASEDPHQVAAVRIFSLVSVGGLASVLVGGFLGGDTQFALWGLAILLDVIAALVGGQADGWNLHPDHFSERHGLFVIIALGETLIVAASGVSGVTWSYDVAVVAVLAVALTCALWWCYFPRVKPLLEEAFSRSGTSERAPMARDTFSLFHFPMLCGIVAFAVAMQEAVTHPGSPFTIEVRGLLAAGVILFVGGVIPAVLRVGGRLLVHRIVVVLATATSILVLPNLATWATLGVTLAGLVIIAAIEQRTLIHTPEPAL